MKVMISQPMNGRSEEEIQRERKEIIEKFSKMHIEVIDTYFDESGPECNNIGIYYLANSIDAMKDIDALFMCKDWQSARGCRIEHQVAKEYGIKILDYNFLYEEEKIKRI